jgi:hypothetical protein
MGLEQRSGDDVRGRPGDLLHRSEDRRGHVQYQHHRPQAGRLLRRPGPVEERPLVPAQGEDRRREGELGGQDGGERSPGADAGPLETGSGPLRRPRIAAGEAKRQHLTPGARISSASSVAGARRDASGDQARAVTSPLSIRTDRIRWSCIGVVLLDRKGPSGPGSAGSLLQWAGEAPDDQGTRSNASPLSRIPERDALRRLLRKGAVDKA